VNTRREFLRGSVQLAAAATLPAFMPAARAAAAAGIKVTELSAGMWLLDGAGCNVVAALRATRRIF
jgi:hypothetical protein